MVGKELRHTCNPKRQEARLLWKPSPWQPNRQAAGSAGCSWDPTDRLQHTLLGVGGRGSAGTCLTHIKSARFHNWKLLPQLYRRLLRKIKWNDKVKMRNSQAASTRA